MARGDKIMFKFKGTLNPDGTPAEFHSGIPAHDLLESDMAGLSDENLITLASSPLYTARNDADDLAARAEKRVEKAEAAAAPPEAVSVTTAEARK